MNIAKIQAIAEMFNKAYDLCFSNDPYARSESIELSERARALFESLSPIEKAHCHSLQAKHRGVKQ